ncbi:MAG TPA: ABATE domain-containing protein [Micromonosporaceae bacterium]|jgi:predicted RNA-binding Zn ribbon-like protein
MINIGATASGDAAPVGGGAPVRDEPLPIELINTEYAAQGRLRDGLSESSHLAHWLAAHREAFTTQLSDEVLSGVDRRHLIEFRALRQAVRGLIVATVESQRPAPADVATLNRASRSTYWWPYLVWPHTGPPHSYLATSQEPVFAALSEIAQLTIRLVGSPHRELVRPCRAPGCVLFYFRTHPRREWCSAPCGNRARVARHYRKWHGTPQE